MLVVLFVFISRVVFSCPSYPPPEKRSSISKCRFLVDFEGPRLFRLKVVMWYPPGTNSIDLSGISAFFSCQMPYFLQLLYLVPNLLL